MSGGVKKPDFLKVYALPSLPDNRADVVVLGEGPGAGLDQFVLDTATLSSLERGPAQLLRENLGALRMRIVNDSEGEDVQEAKESYWARVEMTALSDALRVEARIWRKHMKDENADLRRIALNAYDRIVQHENFDMGAIELCSGTFDLRERIERDDFDLSCEALTIYQRCVEKFFPRRPDLITMETADFRKMADRRINRLLPENQTKRIGEEMAGHLENILAAYAQIAFFKGVALKEIEDGIEWIEPYMQKGHVLEQCAKEVCASLVMARDDLLADKKDPPNRGASTPCGGGSNNLPSVKGEIVVSESGMRVGKMPSPDIPKVIVQGLIQSFGLRLKPA